MRYEISHCVEGPNYYIVRIESSGLHRMIILRKEFRTSPEFQTFFEAVRTFFDNIEECVSMS